MTKASLTRQIVAQRQWHEWYWGLQFDPMTSTGLEQQGNWKGKGSFYCIYLCGKLCFQKCPVCMDLYSHVCPSLISVIKHLSRIKWYVKYLRGFWKQYVFSVSEFEDSALVSGNQYDGLYSQEMMLYSGILSLSIFIKTPARNYSWTPFRFQGFNSYGTWQNWKLRTKWGVVYKRVTLLLSLQ